MIGKERERLASREVVGRVDLKKKLDVILNRIIRIDCCWFKDLILKIGG